MFLHYYLHFSGFGLDTKTNVDSKPRLPSNITTFDCCRASAIFFPLGKMQI